MPAITTLSINDGTVPVTFTPVTKVGNEALFKDLTGASAESQASVKLTFKPHNGSGRVDQVLVDVAVPYEETVDGSPHVEHIGRFQGKVLVPVAVPASERTRLANIAANAIAEAMVQAMIEGPEGIY